MSEADLSQRISIGRTPLREALQRLATQRLLASVPRKGMFVSQIDVPDHMALLEILRPLDQLIAQKAARRATPEQRDALRSCAQEMKKAARNGDLITYLRMDHKCDEIIYTAAGNPFARDAVVPLYSHSRRFWYRYHHNADLVETAELHARLMHAVADGECELASKISDALIDHLEQFTKAVLDL